MNENAMKPKAAERRAFTLVEILVSLSIFVVLGSMLVLALRTGVDTWRNTEDRRLLYEHAQLVLKQIEADLVNMAAPRLGEEGNVQVRLLCDLDANRRYRIRFIRTLMGDMTDPHLRYAGTGSPEHFDGVLNGRDDRGKSLKPLSGLMEVAYVMDPDPASNILYRGVRSPVGGNGSLFRNENLDTRSKVLDRCTPVSDGVLYLGFHFWTQYTTTWKLEPISESLGTACGPERIWDSTRGILPHPKKRGMKGKTNVFWLAVGPESADDPVDDVFPRQVQIHLCVAAGGGAPNAKLTTNLDRKDRVIQVDSAAGFPTEDDPDLSRYVRIGTEWIYFQSRTSHTFEARSQTRGARGTKATSHEEGDEVWGGRTFVLTLNIPAHQGYWSGEAMAKVLARHSPEDPPWVERNKRKKKDKR
ncbi:MAG: PulJ/GspJ family protein [Planctomycetota bacterium]|jgi:prepilin-type N-terminal cleavage/methylation domain-containing protein